MDSVLPTRCLSPPDFYLKGGSQSSSTDVLHIFCRQVGKPLEIRSPCWEPCQQTALGTGSQPPSRSTTASLQVLAQVQRLAAAEVAEHDLPTSWTEPTLFSMAFDQCCRLLVAALGEGNGSTWNWDSGGCRICVESAEKASKQVLTGCWQSSCIVSVLQVQAWLMRKLWREANSLSTWLSQPSLTCVGLGTDRVQHRDCTARAVQVTDEYQGSEMLLLDLSSVFDALRYCWVSFDPQQE